MYRLLLIDDDKEILDVNKKFFVQDGYEVFTASNAGDGLSILKKAHPDCIVLDVMMPDINGFQACKKFREITMIPILFLTALTSEQDKVKGFHLGADDYLEKPYSLRELSVRIQANIRRSKTYSTSSSILSYPPLTIDLRKHKAFYQKEEIALTNREYELLYLLASHPNQLITYEDIGKQLWGTYSESDRRSVMVHLSRLRKKLEAYHDMDSMIETVWSKGYQFIG